MSSHCQHSLLRQACPRLHQVVFLLHHGGVLTSKPRKFFWGTDRTCKSQGRGSWNPVPRSTTPNLRRNWPTSAVALPHPTSSSWLARSAQPTWEAVVGLTSPRWPSGNVGLTDLPASVIVMTKATRAMCWWGRMPGRTVLAMLALQRTWEGNIGF